MRVLILSTQYPGPHAPRLGEIIARQTGWLARRPGVELEVVASLERHPLRRRAPAPQDAGEWNGLTVHRPSWMILPKLRAHDPAAMAAQTLPRLVRLHRRNPFDVIAAQNFWPEGPAALWLSRALRIPFSIKCRGPDLLGPARTEGKLRRMVAAARAAGGLLAVSDDLRARMAELGMPGERIEVHYTGADRTSFHPGLRAGAKAALGLSGPVFLIAGNLTARKGQLRAIEALHLLPEGTLLVAGRGPDAAQIEARAAQLGLTDRVRMLGIVDHDRMPLLNAAADVAILPTTSEGLANAWVDALCCGTPVVTTDVCGAREAIDRPEAGRIVPNDAAAIAAAVRDILACPPAPEAVARAADKFCWERNAMELEDHLRRVAATGVAARGAGTT